MPRVRRRGGKKYPRPSIISAKSVRLREEISVSEVRHTFERVSVSSNTRQLLAVRAAYSASRSYIRVGRILIFGETTEFRDRPLLPGRVHKSTIIHRQRDYSVSKGTICEYLLYPAQTGNCFRPFVSNSSANLADAPFRVAKYCRSKRNVPNQYLCPSLVQLS